MDAIHDCDLLARQLIKAIRGRRSQVELSRRLGYRSNMVHRWESGECSPSAAMFLKMCTKQRIDVAQAFTRFYGRRPLWLAEVEAASAEAVAAFLRDQKGKVALGELARRAGSNRFTLSRWLNGSAEPPLGALLRVIEVSSQRLLDFVSALTDPARVPLLVEPWARLSRIRDMAYDQPWSHAVLRALELASAPKTEQAAWLADRLGAPPAEIAAALALLEATGQVQRRGGRYTLKQVISVNTAHDPERSRALKVSWTETALARLRSGAPGNYGYSVFSISAADLRRLRDVHLEYVRAMQAIIAASQPGECVGLYCAQLLDLAQTHNALDTGARR